MATTLIRRPWFDELFGEIFGQHDADGAWTAALDVQRVDGAIKLEVDMPGIHPEDVHIAVEDGVLTVSGETEEKTEENKQGYLRRERRYGSFRRSMTLPPGSDAAKIEATTKDGVVEVTVPISEPEQPKKIEITPKPA